MTDRIETLRKTPLHALHVELGGKMVPFAGYDMPVQYPAGILKEHLHTREKAGLFDVSHMGQAFLAGDDPARALERVTPADVDGPQGRHAALWAAAERRTARIKDDFMVDAPRGRGGALSRRQCGDEGIRLRLYRRAAERRCGADARNPTARFWRCRDRRRAAVLERHAPGDPMR